MQSVGNFLKKAGKLFLYLLLAFILVTVGVLIWVRIEPEAVTECEAGFRLISHADGSDCVSDSASRVLAISPTASQFYVAIDHPLAMMTDTIDTFTAADIPGLYEKLRDVNEGVLDLGNVQGGLAPNFELLFEIQPDVIVTEWPVGDFSKPAEVIAPVIVFNTADSWQSKMLGSAEVIGERETAVALIADYEARLQILRDQFDDPAEISISIVRLYPDRTAVNLADSFAGQIITDVGFSLPEGQVEAAKDSPEQIELVLSEERVDLLDGDFLFLYGGFPESTLVNNLETSSGELVDAFTNEPIYQFLDAVETGNVYEVDVYWSVTGIYSAHYVLDDLFRHVAGVDPEAVSPNPLRLE